MKQLTISSSRSRHQSVIACLPPGLRRPATSRARVFALDRSSTTRANDPPDRDRRAKSGQERRFARRLGESRLRVGAPQCRLNRHVLERTPEHVANVGGLAGAAPVGDRGPLDRDLGRCKKIVDAISGRRRDQEVLVRVHHAMPSRCATPGAARLRAGRARRSLARPAQLQPRGAWMSSLLWRADCSSLVRGAWMSSDGFGDALATAVSSAVPRKIASAVVRFMFFVLLRCLVRADQALEQGTCQTRTR